MYTCEIFLPLPFALSLTLFHSVGSCFLFQQIPIRYSLCVVCRIMYIWKNKSVSIALGYHSHCSTFSHSSAFEEESMAVPLNAHNFCRLRWRRRLFRLSHVHARTHTLPDYHYRIVDDERVAQREECEPDTSYTFRSRTHLHVWHAQFYFLHSLIKCEM